MILGRRRRRHSVYCSMEDNFERAESVSSLRTSEKKSKPTNAYAFMTTLLASEGDWEIRKTPCGKVYFLNHVTGADQWACPEELAAKGAFRLVLRFIIGIR